MRLLHVTPTYLPAVRYGGPIYSVHGLCAALVGEGHAVDVVTTGVDGPHDLGVAYDGPTDIDGVQVRYFRCGLGRRLYRSPSMAAHLARTIRQYDLVHLHSVYLWPTLVAARAARAAGVPYVLAPRGMLVPELIRRKGRLRKRVWITLLERRNLTRAAAIHATSALERDNLSALGLDLAEVVVVPNGVDTAGSAVGVCPGRFVGLDALAPFALFLGRIAPEKGLDRLIGALAEAPGVALVVAGPDDEGHRSGLEALARRSGVASRIHWVGPVAGVEKAWLLSRALMLVLPSYSENFGNVVLEALAAGCPALTTPEVAAGAEVAAAGAGVVCEGTPARLGAAIGDLAADPARRAALARRGRELVAQRYTWARIARQMAAIYARLGVDARSARTAAAR